LERRLLLGAAYQNPDLIVASGAGGFADDHNIGARHYKPLLQRAGLPLIRLYDLRHSCATLLLAAGEHPKVVQERLGHSTIALTLDVYSHVVPGMQERASHKLEVLLRDADRSGAVRG
jgi:integrase